MLLILDYLIYYGSIIPAAIAIGRFPKINKRFYLFLLCLWIGCANDLLNNVLNTYKYYTGVNNNIYVLIESILLLWFLKRINTGRKVMSIYFIISVLLLLIWLYENIYLEKIFVVSSYFRIIYSFILVLLSITGINKILVSARKNVLYNPAFLLCSAFILYFTTKVIVEVFWLYGMGKSVSFQSMVFDISSYVNLLTNIIFAIAILWMPNKQAFTMPS